MTAEDARGIAGELTLVAPVLAQVLADVAREVDARAGNPSRPDNGRGAEAARACAAYAADLLWIAATLTRPPSERASYTHAARLVDAALTAGRPV